MDGLTHEEALVERHLRGSILLDANLLLLYEIGRFSETAIRNFPHTKQYTIEDYRLLAKFLRLFRSVVTTPNILTEVSNLSGKLNEVNLKAFREGFKSTIDVLEEQYCASELAARSSAFLKFGLTDAGIASLCTKEFLVLTDDLPLAQWLASKGVDVLNFNHIRQKGWSKSN
jgi:hypothetical protein